MPNLLQTIRGKVPSKRALLAFGGAAAVLISGAIQTADTLAAENDAVSANTSQIASQNYFPVLTPISPGYSNPGTCFGGNATISWKAAPTTPAGQKWQIEEWGNVGTTLLWTSSLQTDTSRQTGLEPGGGSTHEYRIYGVNAATEERSTGYVSVYLWRDGGRCNYSKGTSVTGPTNISTWQETTNYQPGGVEKMVNTQTSNKDKFNAPAESQESERPKPAPSSEAAEPSTETSSPSTSEVPESTPSSSTAPESTTEKAPVKITAAAATAGGSSGFIVYHDGVEHCSAPKDATDQVVVGNNEVTLTTKDGAVKKVDVNTCAVS